MSCVERRVSDALRASVSRRVLLALSRFGPRLARVTVSLEQPVNLLGTIDRGCRMRAWLSPGAEVRAEAIDGTIEAAVARAAAQLAERVAVALLEGRDHAGLTRVRGGSATRTGWPRPSPPAARPAPAPDEGP